MSSIKQELRVGESITFDNGRVKVTLLEKSGQRARLDIEANDDVKVKVNKDSSAAQVATQGLNLARVMS